MNTLRGLGIALIVFGLAFGLFAIGERKKDKRGEQVVKIALIALTWLLIGGIVALVFGKMAKARDKNG